MTHRWHGLVALVAAGSLATGGVACGDDGPDAMRPGDRARLHAQVVEVRAALERFDPGAARVALASLRGDVAGLRSRDRITGDRADEVLAAAAELESRLDLAPTTTTTTVTPTTTPRADEEPGNGKGKGKDKDKSDDESD